MQAARALGVAFAATWTRGYDPLGNLRSLSSSTSYTRSWTYGDTLRPRVLTAFSESPGVSDSSISTDGAGNTSARTRGGLPQTFVWNAQNRLYTITGYNPVESFFLSYDAFGRRVHQQITGGSTPTELFYVGADFEYDKTLQQANLIFFVGSQRIASFARFGNYYTGDGWTAWDDFGRRVGPPLGGLVLLVGLAGIGVLATRRRPAWLAGAGAGFLGAGILLLPIPASTGGGGGGSVHGSHGEQGGVYYLPDHLGSTRAVVDLYGAVLETRDYDPWGNSIAHGPSTPTYHLKHGFTSQPIAEVDASNGYGLHNYGARFYDPKWGRFVAGDEVVPAFNSKGVQRFAYVENAPTWQTDPTGHCGFPCIDPKSIPQMGVPSTVLGCIEISIQNFGDALAGAYNAEALSGNAELAGTAAAGALDVGALLDATQLGLNMASIAMDATAVGAVGSWIPDLANVAISAARADWVGVGMYTLAAVPIVGIAANSAGIARGATASVYVAVEQGATRYVGITNNLARRAAEQLRAKGVAIEAVPGLGTISRADARAVEQALIEHYGLSRNGGSLLNSINSIAASNPIYGEALRRGRELLRQAGYPGF